MFKNALLTFSRQILSGVLSFIVVILIARLMGVENNGVFATIMLLPLLASSLLNLGLSPATVYYLAGNKVNKSQAVVDALIIVAIVIILFSTISVFLKWVYPETVFPTLSNSEYFVALTIFPSLLITNIAVSVFQGVKNYRLMNVVLLIQPGLLSIVLATALVMKYELSLLMLLLIMSSVYLISTILALIFCYRIIGGLNHISDRSYKKKLLSFGVRAHLANVIAVLNYKIDIICLSIFLAPIEVGLYAVAVQVAEKLWLFSDAITTVLYPELTGINKSSDRVIIVSRVTRIVTFFTVISALVVGFLSLKLVPILFGVDYIESILPLLILLPGIVIASTNKVIATDFSAQGKPELNMYIASFALVINVVFNIALIPKFGVAGAAMATGISYLVNFIVRAILFSRISDIEFIRIIKINRSDFDWLKNKLINLFGLKSGN